MAKMKWYGKEVTSKIMGELGDRLELAARMLEGEAKGNMGEVGDSSNPGDYPFKQSGNLRRNVASEVDRKELKARWGTNVKYGKYLELGTKKMAARPWMRLTNRKLARRVASILGALIK
jgi:phage gpG-like protein